MVLVHCSTLVSNVTTAGTTRYTTNYKYFLLLFLWEVLQHSEHDDDDFFFFSVHWFVLRSLANKLASLFALSFAWWKKTSSSQQSIIT